MINWKVRLKNPVLWVQLIVALAAPMLAAAGLQWNEVTSWATLGQVILDAIKSPVVIVAMIAAAWGVINDPTTEGLKDSARAMTYERPYKD